VEKAAQAILASELPAEFADHLRTGGIGHSIAGGRARR
jgi:hypothetical protein